VSEIEEVDLLLVIWDSLPQDPIKNI